MQVTITLTDTDDGLVEIEETRLPYSGETAKSLTTASALADEILNIVEQHGEVTACGVPVNDDGEEWEEL